MIVFGDEAHGRAIAKEAGTSFNPEAAQVIARVENGELWGGVTYEGYTKNAIWVHVAGFRPSWMNRDFLWVAFHYPFVQLGVKKIIGRVPSTNRRALKFDVKLGFSVETVIRDVYPDGDLLILSMDRAKCRWLNMAPRMVCG